MRFAVSILVGLLLVASAYALYDPTGDGAVTREDITLIANNFRSSTYAPSADVNLDGKVDLLDVVLVARDVGKLDYEPPDTNETDPPDVNETDPGPVDTTPPIATINLPTQGREFPQGTGQVTLSVSTNEFATCRYHGSDVGYLSMTGPMSGSGTTTHSATIAVSDGQEYTRYVRCQDLDYNMMTSSKSVTWSVEVGIPPPPAPPPPPPS